MDVKELRYLLEGLPNDTELYRENMTDTYGEVPIIKISITRSNDNKMIIVFS